MSVNLNMDLISSGFNQMTQAAAPISKKQFWVAAYLAALHRLPAAEALQEAEEALRMADERWQRSEVVGHFRYTHEFELGQAFLPPAQDPG
ncbi:hypothetical protein [Luteibacter sp. E-22]|jgi:hypothetical protein|uniref:hypothetical protein n=1 Tax=Luteibacter sp. E-22 TaxID=3404050 RepID=UPI003CE680F0